VHLAIANRAAWLLYPRLPGPPLAMG
jgi:hypothetical protein